ncbi:multidrug efflux RND transporter permease subunit [Oleisolibacter albus]|uniref:multidrug efflux RND transporter permease subunit n=1 Tax=Oleisolibacter albus TaxID=2171757 RepID=UPI000DF37557|nr:multidrug efflux RND transporter permease subunit [Oleisolibacter albus]
MRFTDIFVRRPVLAAVVSILILLVGLRAIFALPVRQYPEVSSTVITVTTAYSGATAELMQGFITTPMQQAVAGAEGVDYITSTSTLGVSTVQAHIRLNFDPNVAMTDVMSKVQQVRYLLPQGANDPVITKSTGETVSALYLSFSSSSLSLAAIADYLSREVQPVLATVPGVASASALGGQTFAMRIWLDPARMAGRGITAADVSTALQANNVQAAPGQQKGYFTAADITTNTGLRSEAEFRNLVIKAADGSVVRLSDVAEVELGPKSADQYVAFSGENAVFIGIEVTPTGNPLNVVAEIRRIMPQIAGTLPPGVKMDVAYDSTQFIQASIDDVIHTLGEAVAIVVVVIFLFLGSFRSVLIPLVTIPLSLVGAAALMLALGFSLNLLTLLAFVLAIGLVVDDAIVVVENVYRHIEEGLTPLQAALVGAREIAGPVVAMTITLAAVYAPIGFLGGVTGSLFREFAFTLAGSVLISGIVALTLSPMMSSLLLNRQMLHGPFTQRVDHTFGRLEAAYGRRLHATLNWRPVTLLFAAAILGTVVFLFQNTQTELAPEEDQGVLLGVAKGPQYANIDYMTAYAKTIDKVFTDVPEVTTRFAIFGEPTSNQGFVGAILKPWGERDKSAKALMQEVQGKLGAVPGVQIFLFAPAALPGSAGGLPVQMVVYGTADYSTLFLAMEEIKHKAQASGLFIVTDSDLRFDLPGIRLSVDSLKANELGITLQEIAGTLSTLLGGNYVNRFDLFGRSYEVIPQVPRALRLTPEDLTRYYVRSASGENVPLSAVVTAETRTDPNALTQFNQLNSATFQAMPMPGVTVGDAVKFLQQEAPALLPEGLRLDWLGDSRQYVQEGSQLTVTFAFALLVIFLVLAAQYESWRDPLVVLVTVPLSVCGALLPLFLGMATLNIYSQVGLVTLIGLISKHGILMVSFANQLQHEQGLDRRAAIERAAQVRLRPILMTTAAMVMGLVPMLMASGAGAASRFSIGVVIVCGLMIGTLFTLFVLPMVYTFLAQDHGAARTRAREAEMAEVAATAPGPAH